MHVRYRFECFKIRVKNAYFQNGLSITLPLELPKGIVSTSATVSFTNGKYNIYGKSISGKDITHMNGSMKSLSYPIVVDERVSGWAISKAAHLDTAKDGINVLGGVAFENSGMIDSEKKKLTINFPDKLLITGNNLHASSLDPYIYVDYTLKDDKGEQVYLDDKGKRVKEKDKKATSTWTVKITNSCYNSKNKDNQYVFLKRGNLPDAHREYYFKSISYTIGSMKNQAKLYNYSGNNSQYSAGNFMGYLAEGVKSGENLYTYTLVEGDIKGSLPVITTTTTISTTPNPSYGIEGVSFSMKELVAGEDVDLQGYVFTTSYPYGNTTRLKNIVIGVILPSGVTIDKDNIDLAYGSKTGVKVDVENVSQKLIENGQTLYIIKADPDAVIGYYNEGLGAISTSGKLYFNVSLSTNSKMNFQTMFAESMFFVTGVKYTNSAGGSYDWASGVDKYDLNENGSTTDRLGRMSFTTTEKCIVNPKPPTLDIDDYVQIEGNGTIEGRDAHIGNINDKVTYNLNIKCVDEGTATEFEYYIPIPKVDSGRDEYLVIGDRDMSFDMNMVEEPQILGSQLYYIEYAVSSSLTLTTARKLSESRWYTLEELRMEDKNLSDVTMLRIKTKENREVKVGDNTTIKVKIQADKSKNAVYKDLRNRWRSSGYYNFETESSIVSGYFRTTGCNADISYESEEVEVISLVGSISKDTGVLMVDNTFPKQINDMKKYKQKQTYTLTEIGTTNVRIIDKDVMVRNQDTMHSDEANEKLAFTITLNNNNGNGNSEGARIWR